MRNRFKVNRFIWGYLEFVDYLSGKCKVFNLSKSFPTQLRFPTENGQTLAFFLSYLINFLRYKRVSVKNRILRTTMWKNFGVWRSLVRNYHSNKNMAKCSWNCPSKKKRSGLNTSGCGKSFGLCITAKRDAITIDPFFINVPSRLVSWMHKWGRESPTGRNLKFSSKTALKYGHWSTRNFPFFEKHCSSSS